MVDVTASNRDTTSSARAAHLRESQRVASLGQVAVEVAHDVNNLLGVILSYSSLLSGERAGAAPGDPERWERIRCDVEEIQLAARQGAVLAGRLMAFAGHDIALPAPSSIDEVLAAAPSRPAIETVLVVDDAAPLREATRRLLTRNGYEVITAANGSEAIEVAASHAGPIDLLLTDVIMPAMLGIEVAQRITQDRSDIRVLFMSGAERPVGGGPGRLATGMVLLQKPFSETTLLSKVREVLDEDERLRPAAGVAVQR